jgi:hypothetical protein
MLRSTCRIVMLAAGIALATLACRELAPTPERRAADAPPEEPGPPTCHPRPGSTWSGCSKRHGRRSAARGRWRARGGSSPRRRVRRGEGRQLGRFRLIFEVGPLGIAQHGAIFLQVSPFWGWSTPQVEDTDAPGYTTLAASASDIELDARTVGPQLLEIQVVGRPLVAGERVTLVYGAGPPGASTDRYAERGSRFWFAVDGDGDGVRAVLTDSPEVEVLPGEPAQLSVTLPGVARPGERVAITLALLDGRGNAGRW